MTESDRDKTIDMMARALYEADDYETPWKDVVARYPATYRDARAQAKAALTAYESHLQASGMAVVPVDEARRAWRIGMQNAARTCMQFDRAKNAAREIEALAGSDAVADHNLLAAATDGKAFQPMGSAEARSAVANSGSEKEKDDA